MSGAQWQHDGRGPLGPAKSLKAVAGEAYKSRWLLLPVTLAGVLFYSRFAIAAWAIGQCRVMLHVPWPWMLLTEDQQKDVNFWGGELFGMCVSGPHRRTYPQLLAARSATHTALSLPSPASAAAWPWASCGCS